MAVDVNSCKPSHGTPSLPLLIHHFPLFLALLVCLPQNQEARLFNTELGYLTDLKKKADEVCVYMCVHVRICMLCVCCVLWSDTFVAYTKGQITPWFECV